MAPAANAPAKRATYDGSRPRFQSLEAWLHVYGNAEYAIYKRDAAPQVLSYEDWSKSEHVLGPFLWYTTLDVWEEDSSSDEESEAEAPAFTARAPPKQQPKKAAITNGHGKRGAKSSPSAAQSKTDDGAAATKRKRKPKKAYLSEDIVVSDVSDEAEEPVPAIEAPLAEAAVPSSATNGRRKSGGRRKKQYLSAETIAPEDEDDDSTMMNGTVPSASMDNEPSAPDLSTPVATAASGTPKAKSGKKSKRKSLSQAQISKGEDETGHVPTDATVTPKSAAASPDGPGSSSRRGLRTRTPAQQRPYFHNAQEFDELVSDEPEAPTETQPSPPRPKQKLRLTGLARVSFPEPEVERQQEVEAPSLENLNDVDNNDANNDDIDDPIDEDDEAMIESEGPQRPKKAHYKGKGRAWRKTSDDEDQDYKSPVKVKTTQPARKLGRRKSGQNAEKSAEVPEVEEPAQQQRQVQQSNNKAEPAAQSPSAKPGKKARKPRKVSHLSEEFVRDDSDTAVEEPKEPETKAEPEKPQVAEVASPVQQKTPKKRGRPRKSDQSSATKPKNVQTPAAEDNDVAMADLTADSPTRKMPSSQTTTAPADQTEPMEIDGAQLNGTQDEEEQARPQNKSATPEKTTTPAKATTPSRLSTPKKEKTPKKLSEAVASRLGTEDGREDNEQQHADLEKDNSTRSTEHAPKSPLQALDDSGKAVEIPGQSSTVASEGPAALEAIQPYDPPPESK